MLTWLEADPARHRFDPLAAPEVVRSLSPAAVVPDRLPGSASDAAVIRWSHQAGTRWCDAMSAALVSHYGPWASGWRWSVGEADLDGGPVHAWCCPRDSMTTPEATLTVVAASLVEWRGWLEELAGRFSESLPLPAGDDAALAAWERAAARLVTVVVERTGAESAWYNHGEQVLTWFLTAAGVPRGSHDQLVNGAIGGRFESWVAPPGEVITEVAGQLAAGVARLRDA